MRFACAKWLALRNGENDDEPSHDSRSFVFDSESAVGPRRSSQTQETLDESGGPVGKASTPPTILQLFFTNQQHMNRSLRTRSKKLSFTMPSKLDC